MDLRFVHQLTERTGPFATVYVDVSHDTEDAAHAGDLRWAAARGELARLGADQATLAALDAAVAEGGPVAGRAGRVLVASGGEVVLDRTLPDPPPVPLARWGPVPTLLPLLTDQPEPVSAVVVRVDEIGGEILVRRPGAAPGVEEVRGRDHPVHKARGGGWSHLSMHERVEEIWRQNTVALAQRVDALVAATGADVLVLAGDAPARSRLREALGERAAELAVDVEHSAGSGFDELALAVDEAVQDVVDARQRAVRDRFDQALGRPDGLAVQGVEPVLAALRARAVDTLLVDGEVDRKGSAWIANPPTAVATREDQLRAIGAEPSGEVAVDDALVAAAAASGAAFVPLDGREVPDGVGAILRFPVPAGG